MEIHKQFFFLSLQFPPKERSGNYFAYGSEVLASGAPSDTLSGWICLFSLWFVEVHPLS